MGRSFVSTIYFGFKNDKEITEAKIADIVSQKTDRVQISGFWQPGQQPQLTSAGWKRLNDAVFKKRPEIGLRLFGFNELDLSFLDYVPDVGICS